MSNAKAFFRQDTVMPDINTTNMRHQTRHDKDFNIQRLVQNAAKCIAPVWPLETFIACNPLQGFESQPFEEALIHATLRPKSTGRNRPLEDVNVQMIKWCCAFFDAGQCTMTMPYQDKGFYLAFLRLAYFDKQLHHHKKEAKEFLRQLPTSADEAIKICLIKLHVSEPQAEAFLSQTLRYLPGWAGFVKWKTDWEILAKSEEIRVTLTQFLAVRLVLTYLIWPDAAKETGSYDGDWVKTVLAQIKSNEDVFQKRLLSLLLPELKQEPEDLPRRVAQLVFCIDVRSEPFRRAIESLGDYETFGFAGFFGLPVSIDAFDGDKIKAHCPVLLKPQYVVKERAADEHELLMYERRKDVINRCKMLYKQLKHNVSTPFVLVESLGLWCGLNMLLKSLSPRLMTHFSSRLKAWLKPSISTHMAYDLTETDVAQGLSLQDQIRYAEMTLRLMGLTSGFAKFIILCGHGSRTENNPFASALDCGACAGNHGGMNARLLASILNKPAVRRGLEDVGMHIPLDTVFYGALHNTTTDAVDIHTDEVGTLIYPQLFNRFQADLREAKRRTNILRMKKLSGIQGAHDFIRRSRDWSETRPEWGLARNAAFIVGPRTLTKNICLDGRCFLHSYRHEQDPDGALLETILTAPMVVAQWINSQYLFSTLDNVAFGSGSKITHNVVGTIGVMQGNASDLMHGLPLQSVMCTDDTIYHEPQRLLTLIYAPRACVSQLIEKHALLKNLFCNQWVHLVVIDPINQLSYQLKPTGEWASASVTHV